jgi:hypothetical protein
MTARGHSRSVTLAGANGFLFRGRIGTVPVIEQALALDEVPSPDVH